MFGTQKAREQRFHHGYVCPLCQRARLQRWGRGSKGIQRYRCSPCARMFNDLTRAAMAGTHMPEKWRAFTDTMRDGRSAPRAGAFCPEVMLLDIGLPGLNGYEAARRIRARDWAVVAVLVALTGWGQVDHRSEGVHGGFYHHLVKPVDVQALTALLADGVSRPQ